MVAWCAPTWNGVGYNWATQVPKGYTGSPRTFTHMYAKHYPSPAETAQLVARDHASLLRRILAWQQVVYTDASLPVWLRESLVNILHLITEDGLWAQAKPPSRLGAGEGRPVRDDRVSAGMPADRVHPVLVLRQHAAGLFLPRAGPLDAARLQGLSVSGRGARR